MLHPGGQFKIMLTEAEFNEFEPRFKSAENRFSIERLFKSWNIEYNFKWN